MKLEDIINIKTIENIQKYGINIGDFEDIISLRFYITSIRNKIYRNTKKEYYKIYMRERYRSKRNSSTI